MNDQMNRLETMSPWLSHSLEEFERDPDFVAEGLAIRFTSEIARLMAEQGVSRSSLAETLGVSRAYVTKIMNAPPNLTLRSLVSVAMPLDAEVVIDVVPKGAARAIVASEVQPPVATAADSMPERSKILKFPTAAQAELTDTDAPRLAFA